MVRLAENHPANIHEPFALHDVSDFVQCIGRAMKAIAQLYANALDDDRLDPEMLIGLLTLGSGTTRTEWESTFAFANDSPGDVLDRLVTAGFVSALPNDNLRPTIETQTIFRRLSGLAQQENLRWRAQLQNVPGGHLVLDDFLAMLRIPPHD